MIPMGRPPTHQYKAPRAGTQFTEEQKTLIRRLYAEGWTQKKIADRFSVDRSVISRFLSTRR